MVSMNAIARMRTDLDKKAEDIKKIEDEKYASYYSFLTEEYVTWLNEVLSKDSTVQSDKRVEVLLDIIWDFIRANDSEYTISVLDNGFYSLNLYIEYFGKVFKLNGEFFADEENKMMVFGSAKFTKVDTEKEVVKNAVGINYLTQYVMVNLCQRRDNKQDAFDKAIESLQESGMSINDILGLLEVKYATLANKAIRSKK